tara:strand:+ start:61 stop:615 length:555 start_codon:yes stop_codon:yes gene_type:complete
MDLGIPIENFIEDVEPNMFLFYKNGCYHYFSSCSPQKKILSIYRQPIWPGVQRIRLNDKYINKKSTKPYKPRFFSAGIGTGRQFYPTVSLDLANQSYIERATKRKPRLRCSIKRINMHRIVSLICIIKPSPKHQYVDHINGDRCDYRISNLRWTTPRENAVGSPGPPIDPDELYDLTRQISFKM